MAGTKIAELRKIGQSIWLDYISRSLIESGKLKGLIDSGLSGMTSNPTIFDKAISSGSDYDKRIAELHNLGKSPFEIYDELTVRDIRDAADIFKPLYEKTKGLDGYVSLEINPKLAFKTEETIEEGRRLYKKVDRPNLMLKVPSTENGFEAVEELTASGINVNITLIFSLRQYIATARAYINGIKRFLRNGRDPRGLHSVASVFVSRVDTMVDKILDERIAKEPEEGLKDKLSSLKGKAAVANSGLIYCKFREIISSAEFTSLRKRGVNLQRVLWGSTKTKNAEYSDIKYVTELIGRDTVNTAPQETIDAFLDHGDPAERLSANAGKSRRVIDDLKNAGIDIDGVCAELLRKGVAAFEESFDSLLMSIEKKSAKQAAIAADG